MEANGARRERYTRLAVSAPDRSAETITETALGRDPRVDGELCAESHHRFIFLLLFVCELALE
jgi:hypothetical protein